MSTDYEPMGFEETDAIPVVRTPEAIEESMRLRSRILPFAAMIMLFVTIIYCLSVGNIWNISLILPLVAMVVSIVGLKKNTDLKWLNVVNLVVSSLFVALPLLMIVFMAVVFGLATQW